MEQQPYNYQPWQGGYVAPPVQPVPVYPAGKKELGFGAVLLLCSIFLWNCILYGGFNLGFAFGTICVIGCSVAYLLSTGHRLNWYSGALILLSIVIACGFGRSADGFVKYVMFHFLLLAMNLGLCLLTGQNRRCPNGVMSLLDAPRALFMLGFGGMGAASRGLNDARKNAGTAGKKGGAVIIGLVIAIPIMVVMIALLAQADAAFEGMLDKLPKTDWIEIFTSVILGGFFAWVLYCRGAALRHSRKPAPNWRSTFQGFNALTINTILAAVCLVYAAYLVSQLAYLSGGFAGILPEGFTMAEYARRGFFEMAWLCAINLAVICCGVGLVRKDKAAPLATRILCLFVGVVTVFLVATASAKMFMYIGSYGLTRLRVLTEVIMIFMGLTTVLVCLWLFIRKLPYMKLILVLALIMGAGVLWADVDTQVAKYNVEAYQSGKLETVDVAHLSTLGPGAVPYLYELTEDTDPEIAKEAKDCLDYMEYSVKDFRGWNRAKAEGAEILAAIRAEESAHVSAYLTEQLGMDFPQATVNKERGCDELANEGKTYLSVTFTEEQDEALRAVFSANDAWKALPLTGTLERILRSSAGNYPHFQRDYGPNLLPVVENGYYFFRDHHPENTDPTDDSTLLTRKGYCFTIAVYDTATRTLHYFHIDTLNMQSESV